MGKRPILAVASLIVVLGLAILAGLARAQEATPSAVADEAEVAPGVTFTLLPASEDPPSLYRLAFEPGATLYFAGDPAISLVLVETGALSLNMNAAVSDARVATPVGDDSAIRMDQGDYFVLPPQVVGELRNTGEEPASILIAAITPGQFPVVSGTPVPG